MPHPVKLTALLARFARDERGSATLEFVLLFPAIWLFFMLSIETGTLSMRQVMLERGLDLTVRDVRIGVMPNPTHDDLVKRLCQHASLLPNCLESTRLEMIPANARNFTTPTRSVTCIDRSATGSTVIDVTNGLNNQLMILRVCSLFKPTLAMAFIGHKLAAPPPGSSDEYALAATSAYVMEPFR